MKSSITPSKYKFSRDWYVASYAKNITDHEVATWCTENFGCTPKHPDAWTRWTYGSSYKTIRFRDEQDYMWFLLRWS
jgi:hypothetical protein